MLFNVTMIPIGSGDNLTEPIALVVRRIADSGLPYQLTGTSTLIEGEWREVMPLLESCVEELAQQSPRVYASITIDHHPGKTGRIREAVQNVEEALGRDVRTEP